MENLGIECKQLMAKEIKQRLEGSSHLFITTFGAIGVSEQDQLRRKLQETEANLFVVKNSLLKRVCQQLKLEALIPAIKGFSALTLGGRDAVSVSKTLVNFAKANENFKILGAYVDEQLLDTGSVQRLAAIPSKEALLAQVVYAINSPIQGLVNTLSATIKSFVVVIDRIRKEKENG